MLAAIPPKHPAPSARDRLLDVALELFATRGYQTIGLRDLAGQLGLQAGSLYNHIENKQSLLFELIEGAVSDLLAGTRRSMRGARTHRERLRRFVHATSAMSNNRRSINCSATTPPCWRPSYAPSVAKLAVSVIARA